MTRGEMKLRARYLLGTTRPHPCLVTLTLLAVGWLISYLAQKIGGQPVVIDLDAAQKLNFSDMIRIDLANAEFLPTVILLAFQIVVLLLSFGYAAYILRVVRGEPSGFGNLLDGFGVAWRAIVLTVFVDALIAVASVFLLIPGIILSYSYAMTTFLLLDHPDWSPVRCMRESRYMMRGHKWEFFVLHLSFIGWLLLSAIPGVSVFVKPYTSLTEAVFYENLRGAYPPRPTSEF